MHQSVGKDARWRSCDLRPWYRIYSKLEDGDREYEQENARGSYQRTKSPHKIQRRDQRAGAAAMGLLAASSAAAAAASPSSSSSRQAPPSLVCVSSCSLTLLSSCSVSDSSWRSDVTWSSDWRRRARSNRTAFSCCSRTPDGVFFPLGAARMACSNSTSFSNLSASF